MGKTAKSPPTGLEIHKGWLDEVAQRAMLDDIRGVVAVAPLFSPVTPWGKPMSVRMTSAGRYGWITDRRGYRYADRHPDGQVWPAIPQSVLDVWVALAGDPTPPDCCLINFYGEGAKMGLHQDKDEADFSHPVLSISLGDPARFRMGGLERGDPTSSVMLESGDVVVMGGEGRRAFHGVDRIEYGGSDLLAKGGRINLTLRVVD